MAWKYIAIFGTLLCLYLVNSYILFILLFSESVYAVEICNIDIYSNSMYLLFIGVGLDKIYKGLMQGIKFGRKKSNSVRFKKIYRK